MSGVPKCHICDVEQPFLLNLNPQINVVNFTCNECGHKQTRVIGDEK